MLARVCDTSFSCQTVLSALLDKPTVANHDFRIDKLHEVKLWQSPPGQVHSSGMAQYGHQYKRFGPRPGIPNPGRR